MKLSFKKHLLWPDFHFQLINARHGHNTVLHEHDFHELVFVRSGEARHRCGGEEHPVTAGSFFLVTPRHPHMYHDPHDFNISNLLFSRTFLKHVSEEDQRTLPVFQMLFGEQQTKPIFQLEDRFFPEADSLLTRIEREQEHPAPGSRTMILGCFLDLITLLCRHGAPASGTRPAGHAVTISRLLAELEAHFEEKWSLHRMAEKAGLSESLFRQQFRQFTGLPPGQYLQKLRLEKAASLMQLSPRWNVTEIALACGFCDANYFARQFRAAFNCSPGEYKRRP